VGTIVGIFENKEVAMLPQSNKMVAALYVLYGPATELIIAVDQKVSRYVMDSNKTYMPMGHLSLNGKFKKVYSINEGNHSNWDMDIKQWIEGYKQANYSARYIGSMVGDVHRTLLYGGSFCYPADKKNKNGKLRLLYEAWPMAMIIETAGGRAIVGNRSSQRILDVASTELHQRTPILLGSQEEVARYDAIRSKL
jgi:fructose-1,6-bisphosphatase I